MTMFESMQNAFSLLCGIICIVAAVLIVFYATPYNSGETEERRKQLAKEANHE